MGERRVSMLGSGGQREDGSASNCRPFRSARWNWGTKERLCRHNQLSECMPELRRAACWVSKDNERLGRPLFFIVEGAACSSPTAKEGLCQLVCRFQGGTKCPLVCSEASVVVAAFEGAPCCSAALAGSAGERKRTLILFLHCDCTRAADEGAVAVISRAAVAPILVLTSHPSGETAKRREREKSSALRGLVSCAPPSAATPAAFQLSVTVILTRHEKKSARETRCRKKKPSESPEKTIRSREQKAKSVRPTTPV